MRFYIALLREEADTDIGVSFPDFPGCVTAGSDLDEARANAAEALALHVAGMTEDGEAIPTPASLDCIMADAENNDGIAIAVPLESPARKARYNVTLDVELVAEIDAVTSNRSQFLEEAARARLGMAAKAQRSPRP